MVHPDKSRVVCPHSVPIALDERLQENPWSDRRRPVPVGRRLGVSTAAVGVFRGPERGRHPFIRSVVFCPRDGKREGAEEERNVVEIKGLGRRQEIFGSGILGRTNSKDRRGNTRGLLQVVWTIKSKNRTEHRRGLIQVIGRIKFKGQERKEERFGPGNWPGKHRRTITASIRQYVELTPLIRRPKY